VDITLYAIPISNPSNAARGMLQRKRLDYRLVRFPPGFHPWLVRAAGFEANTVPAMVVDGRKVQTSLAISRELDLLEPRWPLFPADPERRRAVEAAERWGEAELQPVPRRIFRWAMANRRDLRRWFAAEVLGTPLPGLTARSAAIPRHLAGLVDATAEAAEADVAALPATLDRVDALIADGVIGGAEPNAADYQLLATVRSLGLISDVRPALAGRPCEAAALRLFPRYDGIPAPSSLPPEWLAPLRPASALDAA
jgi:glutathione S-transferase